LGQLAQESSSDAGGGPDLTLNYQYDPTLHTLSSVTDNLNGATGYTWNSLGQLVQQSLYVGGTLRATVAYGYDAAGQMTSLSRSAGGVQIGSMYGYDKNGAH